VDNRTTALRVLGGSAGSTRVETRVTGSDINPYLAIAASLASGLYGIEQGLTLDAPAVSGNAYEADDAEPLPSNLREATERLADSEVARELFGEEFVDHFVRTRRWELEQFEKAVTDWELHRYFELI
jgi:glutamine synthetase